MTTKTEAAAATKTETAAGMEKRTVESGRAIDAINVESLLAPPMLGADENTGELVNIALRRKARINVKGLDSDDRDWTAKGENKHWRWIDIGFLPCVAEMDEDGQPTRRFLLALGSEMVTYSAPTKAMPVGTIRAAVHLDASDALDAAEPFYIGAVSNKAARQVLADISAEEKEEREAYEALARIQLKKQWNRHRLECLDKGCDEMSLEDFGAALVLKEAKAAAAAAAAK